MEGEGNCKWSFREYDQFADKLQGANDPIISKFKENFFKSLVRESIQNSMDAKDPTKNHIEVKFDLSTVSKDKYPNLFGIKEHICACKETFSDNNRAQEIYGPMSTFLDCEKLDIITISDYNTSGMPYEPDNIYNNPFLAFINSDGQSVKNKTNNDGRPTTHGGSFGIGKGAYFLMSPIRSLMASTMVADEARNTYFEGVARLCTHDINGKHYYHMGFYSHDGQHPVSGDDIPDDFRRREVGTSISILGKYEDLGTRNDIEDEIEKAVIINFWLAIHNEKLVVTVGDRKPINKERLETIIKEIFHDDDYKKVNPFLFYKAYITPKDDAKFFKFYLKDDPLLGNCELHVRLGDAGKNDRITCMRDMNMLIQTIPNPKPRHAGISATFICLGDPGNKNLELTEDESHTSWTSDGKAGEAKKRANDVIGRMNSFIVESIDSILGTSSDKIDIAIDSLAPTEEDMRKIESNDGESGNPFGVVRDESENLMEGFDRFSVPNDYKEKSNNADSSNGGVIMGPNEGGEEDGVIPTPTGRGVTRTRIKKRELVKKPGKGKKDVDSSDPTQKEWKIVPAYFDVAAHLEDKQWVHTIFLEVDEDDLTDNSVYVDIAVGAETGEDINVAIKTAQKEGKTLKCHGSRVIFENLLQNNIVFDIVFEDNMRHTIMIG